jgi:cytochrome c biogenesis protein CcmG, thiol:disulfide interchange protein DsbE
MIPVIHNGYRKPTAPVGRSIIALAIIVLTCAGAGYAQALKPGDTFPSFYLKDIDGADFFSNQYIGEKAPETVKAVVFSFCASYCKPCKVEIPELGKLSEKYRGRGIHVFLVALENQTLSREIVKETDTKLRVLIDRYLVVQKLVGFQGIPFTVLVDRSGVIRLVNTGFSENQASETIKRLDEAVRIILDGTADASGGNAR